MKTATDLLSQDSRRSASVSAQRKSFASDFMAGRDVDGESPNRMARPVEQSAWIFAALQLQIGEITAIPLKWYLGDEEYTEPGFLGWWQKPARVDSRERLPLSSVIEAMVDWDRIRGEHYLLLDDEWLLSGAKKAATASPFIVARPDRLRKVVQGGELLGYVFTDASGRQYPLVPEQVVAWRRYNPYDHWTGLSALESVRMASESDYYAGRYVRDLMENNGDQGPYIIAESMVDDPQREQLVADLRAKRAARRRGDFRPMFLTGNIRVEDAKAQAPDAALQGTRLMSRHEIFIGLGVPPSMADVKQAYSIGKDSDRYQLITSTCQPLGKRICESFSRVGSMMTGLPLEAELDWDEHPVMVEVRHGRVETALKLWGTGMSMKAANEYLGLGMKPFKGWEVGYLPFSVAPVESASADPVQDPALAEPQEQEPEDTVDPDVLALRLLVSQRCACHRDSQDAAEGAGEIFQKKRAPQEVAAWREHMKRRRESAKAFESRINRLLIGARAEVLRKLDAAYKPEKSADGAVVVRGTAADFLFNLAEFAEGFRVSMRKQQELTLGDAAKQLFSEIGKDDPYTMPPEKVLAFVKQRENRLSGVPADIHEKIKAALDEGINAGESTAQLSDRIRAAFNGLSRDRATMIAQTETSAAYGYSRDVAMKAAGVSYKRWLTSGNSNVRAAHADANGQTVPVDDPFIVGGELLQHPGDNTASAGNTINCHCVAIAVAEPSST